ncbi:MAG: hypothetical protein JXB26_13700 [Candidatus Aminicenantes bacterium]|nr:hypothetical protein [Candidatus Aminicenantes bacterium]
MIDSDSVMGRLDRLVYKKAEEAYDYLMNAIKSFEGMFGGISFPETSDYYRAKNLLKQGESSYEEVLKNARKYLGPVPDYASKDFEEWRKTLIAESQIIAKGMDLAALKQELAQDELMRKMMPIHEIEAFLGKHFNEQKIGKRKLPNIKARMIIMKLQDCLTRAKDLDKTAQKFVQPKIT